MRYVNLLFLGFIFLLVGCYRIDVQQGNIITAKVYQIQPGMTTAEVVHLLGNPVLINPFDDKKLIYVYTFKPGVGRRKLQQAIIYFSNGRVKRMAIQPNPILQPVLTVHH